MKNLRINYNLIRKIFFSLLITLFLAKNALSQGITFEINGNKFTDTDVIISLLDGIPNNLDKEYSNDIIQALIDSNLFSDVSVKFIDNKYIIYVTEFPNIDNLYFKKNERLKDEDLELIAREINLTNLNSSLIKLFIKETKKLYESFGYNDVSIEYETKIYEDTNTADLFFEINEGRLTKIDKIIISGNATYTAQDIYEIIKSKTKSLRNIFANNNYKPITVERDRFLISNFYKNNGFLDVNVQSKIEYLQSNKVNIYFNIDEGNIYSLSSINFQDREDLLNANTLDLINNEIKIYENEVNIFSIERIQLLKEEISSIIIESGVEFFEINSLDKIENNNIDFLFELTSIKPKYTKQINIVGNSRTFDYVIRRELDIAEGDPFYSNQKERIINKLNSLNLFEKVRVKEEIVENNIINLIIEVEEKQTGTFNAGVSVGTLDGFSIVTGLRERNFYGTGRSLEILVNTSEDKNQFKLETTDRLSFENNADISYNINYKQQDFSKASSYKLDTFSSGIGIRYQLNDNLYHNIDLEYVLKNYDITNSSTVSSSIAASSGANMSYLIKNNILYSSLNPGFISKDGNYLNFNNTIETPTSSSNGFVRNIVTFKKFKSFEENILSIQTKFGNIFSLNNNDILTDDKFALGGRWLRGFDSYGVGPRNSRTSYVGGNNIAVAKIDYSHALNKQSNFPFYLNIFNDYGLIWDNKTKPSQSDNSLRSSAGFGLRYYSPIGPIGFSWGFPLMDEDYDIKRMFLFSIGNID